MWLLLSSQQLLVWNLKFVLYLVYFSKKNHPCHIQKHSLETRSCVWVMVHVYYLLIRSRPGKLDLAVSMKFKDNWIHIACHRLPWGFDPWVMRSKRRGRPLWPTEWTTRWDGHHLFLSLCACVADGVGVRLRGRKLFFFVSSASLLHVMSLQR